MTWSS